MNRLLDEATQLIQILYRHNVTIKDLEIFAEWNDGVGAHGDKLRDHLNTLKSLQIIKRKDEAEQAYFELMDLIT